MQLDELILMYCKKCLSSDLSEGEYFYPLIFNSNFTDSTINYRIYADQRDRSTQNSEFILHTFTNSSSVVKLLSDDVCTYINDHNIHISDENGNQFIISTFDEYFNLSLNMNISIQFSTLESIRELMKNSDRTLSMSIFLNDLENYVR